MSDTDALPNMVGVIKIFAIIVTVQTISPRVMSSSSPRIYGVDLELLKIRPALPPSSFQYELQVDYSKTGNMIDFGMVSLRTVASNHELIFPEFANRNPFSLRAESQGVVCFRLYQLNRILLEDCWQIRDLASAAATNSNSNSFYNSETFTKTKADGTMLTYKITQYLINDNAPNSGAAADEYSDSPNRVDKTPTAAQGGAICPLSSCSSTCTAPLVFAILEAVVLFILTVIFVYCRHCRKADANNENGKAKSQRPMINAANNKTNNNNNNNNVGDSSKNEKKFCWPTNGIAGDLSDVKKTEDETKRLNNGGVIYSTTGSGRSTVNEYASSGGSSSDDYYDNNNNNKWSTFIGGVLSGIWPRAVGRQIRTALRNAKRKSNAEPPEPPPPDYRNETFDVDDPQERVYDSIDEKHLDNIVYRK